MANAENTSRYKVAKVKNQVRLVRNPDVPMGLLELEAPEAVDKFMPTAMAMMDARLQGARDREPESARELLGWIIDGLRKYRELPPPLADFVADSLEKTVANPKNAGVAFGLVAKRRRPISRAKYMRDEKLSSQVFLLQQQGVPLKDGCAEGAYTRVARKFNTSKSTVARAHAKKLKFIRRFARALEALKGIQ